MKVKNPLILLAAFFCLSVNSYAKITLPSTIGSNMVIQRESTFKLWGWANPNQELLIKATWNAKGMLTVTADNSGRWETEIPTGRAGGPYGIRITGGKDDLIIENIMLGDVWICSGQSNMEFTINMFGGWNRSFEKDKKDLVDYKFQNIRLFTVQKDSSSKLKETCTGKWLLPDTLTVADFSATAWFYGLELYKKTGIPIGLVVTAWGGTTAEAWTPGKVIDSDPAVAFYKSAPNASAQWPSKPSVLYNAMINPLLSMKIAGAIWYQGEANVNDASHYRDLFTAMIKSWRKAWNSGDFPFCFVQIAPYSGYGTNSALLREAQFQALSLENTGMAVTLDIAGDASDIHPVDKQDVGKRLALWALANKYGEKAMEFSGPVFKNSRTEGSTIRIYFDHADSLYVKYTDARQFYIAGDDRLFVPAKVKADSNSIVVWSDVVTKPVAVRYAFQNDSKGVLYNRAGLPASSFRTDSWPVFYENVALIPSVDPVSKKLKYNLKTDSDKNLIHYVVANIEPGCSSTEFKTPFEMPETCILRARTCVDGFPSDNVCEYKFTPSIALGAKVVYYIQPSARYSGNGALTLVDGLTGSIKYGDMHWQGFEGSDLDIVIDLGKVQTVRKIILGFLEAPSSWIFLPATVSLSTSDNGDKFTDFDPVAVAVKPDLTAGTNRHVSEIEVNRVTKYLKITAKNIGTCPPGHPGQGKPAWMFVDEITVK
jgi:sialate O-acetylesterase